MSGSARIRIDPSGRPVERAGFEALVALALVVAWVVAMSAVFSMMSGDMAGAVGWPMLSLSGLALLCWIAAEHVVGRLGLIWPGSALGILGPLSLGFALALSTPELRVGAFQDRLAIIATVAGIGMIPFLVRFRLPGLVSPIITFTLVGLFLMLYGADPERIRQMEGFSPRGIIAALMTEPAFVALFGVLGAGAVVLARRLDMSDDNFGLASARPLHLVGAGVLALVAGRLLAMLPQPLDLAALLLAFVVATVWTLRVNRIAVAFAAHFAMAKPLILSAAALAGVELDVWDWVAALTAILLVDLGTWPTLHRLSQRLGWTLGPGGRVPPADRPGVIWRFWPYAGERRENAP